MMGKHGSYLLGFFGILIVIIGAGLEWYGDVKIISYTIQKKTELVPDSDALKRLEKLPLPIIVKVYFFNVTNPEEVNQGAKPKLEEVGPYVYDQWKEKEVIKFHEDGTLSYKEKKTYFYNSEMSKCRKETDTVVILNTALLGAVLAVEEMMPDVLSIFNGAIPYLFPGIKNIFVTATVKELLFDGVLMNCNTTDFTTKIICSNMVGKVPETIRQDGKNFKFSFLHHKNQSRDDVFRIYSGSQHPPLINHVYSYNNETNLKVWTGEYCNMINGTDATQYQSMLEKKYDKVYVFEPDFCRSLYADYEREFEYKGMQVIRYSTSKTLLVSGEYYPENRCYCKMINDNELKCPKNGTIEAEQCVRAPTVLTYPHFYLADPEFLEYAELSPDEEKHGTFIEIEKHTGMPVNGSKKIQINMPLKRVADIDVLANVSTGLFPVVWFEESFVLEGDLFQLLTGELGLINLIWIGTYCLIGLGVIIIVVAYIWYAKNQKILCWEGEIDKKIRSGKVHAFEGGVNGTYNEKFKTFQLYDSQVTDDFKIRQLNGRNGAENRRTSQNTDSYIENFM